MKKTQVARLVRVLGLTLVIWPFIGSEEGVEKVREASWQLPEVGQCEANEVSPNSLGYDSGFRCVVGVGGCNSFDF